MGSGDGGVKIARRWLRVGHVAYRAIACPFCYAIAYPLFFIIRSTGFRSIGYGRDRMVCRGVLIAKKSSY